MKPMDIETRSMAIIESELAAPLDPALAPIIKRVIHTTADFSYAENLRFSPGVVEMARDILARGGAIITDTTMAAAGINKRALEKLGASITCFMADEDVAREAIARGESVSTGFFMGKTLYFALGKTAIAVEAYPASRVLLSAILRSLGGNLILIALGLLLVYLISRRLALPLVNLTRATRQVAKGNFDVSLNLQQARFAGGIEEIAELTENFNRMARELKNVEYLRRDFTGNLSHELKTPVSSISGYARLLQCDDLPSDERREFARAISEESARLSSLSDNLLKLTRLESQPPDAVRTPFSLDEQLRRLINACHPQIERKKQTIDVSLGRVTLSAYEELLSQVWRNLLENAIKFTPEGGKLFVSLTRARACAIVAISDTGP
ncbi:MAG: precorrin-8X methylmutase, partial [Clostridia bacterium]